jgi:hypothetical protein
MPKGSEPYRKKIPSFGSERTDFYISDWYPPKPPPPHRRRATPPAFRTPSSPTERRKTKNVACAGTGIGTSTVPQSMLRKQNQGSPRAATAHSGPAFDPMGARLGPAKRVRFSCEKIIIPQVFNPSPPNFKPHPDPDPSSVSGPPRLAAWGGAVGPPSKGDLHPPLSTPL